MIELLKLMYRKTLAVDHESRKVVSHVCLALEGKMDGTVIDVGCGFGRTLRLLKVAGIDATGIDINPEIVAHNRRDGLVCLSPEEFVDQHRLVDVLIMSHVVEHFNPRDLLIFIDTYLSCLRPGGCLVIATPLASDRFFDDFDHIRPYQPLGLSMVFGENQAQVQFRGKHRLKLVDLWFRRSPFAIAFARGLYIRSWTSRWVQLTNLFGAIAFRLSGGLIGRTTGWVGLYRKS